jgi:DNA-directed RNA polymerase subunit RPC12/RpoP
MAVKRPVDFYREVRHISVICPYCSSTWLVTGLQLGDTYTCKKCAQKIILNEDGEIKRHLNQIDQHKS